MCEEHKYNITWDDSLKGYWNGKDGPGSGRFIVNRYLVCSKCGDKKLLGEVEGRLHNTILI